MHLYNLTIRMYAVNIGQWRVAANATLAQRRNTSSLALNSTPHSNTTEHCDLLVVLPATNALFNAVRTY
jgi:hypothetical protein